MGTASLDDTRRLRAVHATGLLDTEPEEAFDRLGRLAATLLDAPHAFITLVDERRSFWKTAIGVDPGIRENTVQESFCQYVIASDEPLIVGDAANDARTRGNPSIERMGVAAWAGVPFRGPDGDTLGSFCVVDVETRVWTDRDQQILQTLSESAEAEVALRAALKAEQAARLEADTAASNAGALARTLQESLLPPRLPATPGIDIAAKYRPAGAGVEVVGDFYDVFQSESGGWNVVIGDVTGKGVEAAKVTALAHYTLRAAAMRPDTPSAVLATLNQALLDQVSIHDPRFLTALYLSCTPTASGVEITLCTAGHDPPVLKRRTGETAYVEARGTLLGAFDAPTLTDVSLELAAGDQLLLYTDGVVDSRRERVRLGSERLHEIVARSAARTAHELVSDVDRAVMDYNDGLLPDDAAIVALVAAPL